MVTFADKKASGDKEIYLIDSKGTAGTNLVERFKKGILLVLVFLHGLAYSP